MVRYTNRRRRRTRPKRRSRYQRQSRRRRTSRRKGLRNRISKTRTSKRAIRKKPRLVGGKLTWFGYRDGGTPDELPILIVSIGLAPDQTTDQTPDYYNSELKQLYKYSGVSNMPDTQGDELYETYAGEPRPRYNAPRSGSEEVSEVSAITVVTAGVGAGSAAGGAGLATVSAGGSVSGGATIPAIGGIGAGVGAAVPVSSVVIDGIGISRNKLHTGIFTLSVTNRTHYFTIFEPRGGNSAESDVFVLVACLLPGPSIRIQSVFNMLHRIVSKTRVKRTLTPYSNGVKKMNMRSVIQCATEISSFPYARYLGGVSWTSSINCRTFSELLLKKTTIPDLTLHGYLD